MVRNLNEKGELKFVLGRSGTGKSEYAIEEICNIIKNNYDRKTVLSGIKSDRNANENIYLIVPEQFSFEMEREILKRLGPRMSASVKVWSFTRMAEGVFRKVGGIAGRKVDDPTRILLVSKALNQTVDWLRVYNRSALFPKTVRAITAMITELKICGIADRRMEEVSLGLKEGLLKNKAEDIALILSSYNALIANVSNRSGDLNGRYVDPLDELTLLCDKIPETNIFDGAKIFIDSFKGFTGQEFSIIEQLLKKCSAMTVLLCCDGLYDKLGGFGLFAPVIDTADTIRNIARKNSIAVATPIILEQNQRFKNDTLKFVEKHIFGGATESEVVFLEQTDNLAIVNCDDIYNECDFVARDIRRRIRESENNTQQTSLRFRDVAIVARDIEMYRGILDVALEKQELAYNLDARTDIRTEPLISFVLSALDSVNGGFNSDEILRLIKTGLFGFSTSSISLIENYVFTWQINYNRWNSNWSGNPDGMTAVVNEKSTSKLWYINLLRNRIMKGLTKLKLALRQNPDGGGNSDGSDLIDGESFANSIYNYLINSKCDKVMRIKINQLEQSGRTMLAKRMVTVWDSCMGILDRFATIFKGFKASKLYFTKLFKVVAENVDIGEIPHSLDGVHLGSADRIRFSSPKIVYIIGANEGVFPAYPLSAGLLSDKERRELISLDLPLAAGVEKKALEEKFIAYQAISAPSDTLVISYINSDGEGKEAQPSQIVELVSALVPNAISKGESQVVGDIGYSAKMISESGKDFIENTALLWRDSTVVSQSYREVLADIENFQTDKQAEYSRFSTLLRGIDTGVDWAFEESANARRLFGHNITLSPSMTELYHQCQFAYFCRYGLRAKPLQVAELDSLAFGTLAHYVLENLLPRYIESGIRGIKKSQTSSDTQELIHQYVEQRLGGVENKSAKFVMLLQKLVRVVAALMWQVVCELSQSEFVPVDYELAIGIDDGHDKGAVEPILLTQADGTTIRIVGKIDRVDVYKKDGISFVRVIDYKTGKKDFKLSDITEGLNMQMLIYLSTLWQNGKERYGKVMPAGMLYLPATLPVINSTVGGADNPDIEQIKEMKMNGLLLDNAEIISAMQTEETNGVFIPAKLKKDGGVYSSSSVASLEQFGMLKAKAESLIEKMAENLLGGEIPAIPTAGSVEACEWCDYAAICGRNSDDPTRFIKVKNLKDTLSSLDNQATDEAAQPSVTGGDPVGP